MTTTTSIPTSDDFENSDNHGTSATTSSNDQDQDDEESSTTSIGSSSADNSNSSRETVQYDTAVQEAQHKTAKKITNIAFKATQLVDRYTTSDQETFLNDPIKVFDEVDQICDDMKDTWEEYRMNMDSIQKEKEVYEQNIDKKFRKVYMDAVTETFADELDDLRHGRLHASSGAVRTKVTKNDNEKVPDILMQENIVMPKQSTQESGGVADVNVDVNVLAAILESGMDGWSTIEKELFLIDWRKDSHEHDMDVDEMTPHERRRREVFGK